MAKSCSVYITCYIGDSREIRGFGNAPMNCYIPNIRSLSAEGIYYLISAGIQHQHCINWQPGQPEVIA